MWRTDTVSGGDSIGSGCAVGAVVEMALPRLAEQSGLQRRQDAATCKTRDSATRSDHCLLSCEANDTTPNSDNPLWDNVDNDEVVFWPPSPLSMQRQETGFRDALCGLLEDGGQYRRSVGEGEPLMTGVGIVDAVRLGTLLAGILAAISFAIAVQTAEHHDFSEEQEELAGDFFFVGIVCLVAAITGIVYFINLGRSADLEMLPLLFFFYLLAAMLYFLFCMRLVILMNIATHHVRERLGQGLIFLILAVIIAIFVGIVD
ncbi:MAG: hypothetical protein U0031_09375 [Thermomicrobiales bacterium]